MNPFIESTVAVPSAQTAVAEPDPAQKKTPAPRLRLAVPRRGRFCLGAARRQKKSRRSAAARVLGALCLATSMALAGSLLFPATAFAVNVNSATPAQLQSVRGIGPKTARIIVDERRRGGDYESFEDLADRVKGIGPKKAASLQSAGLTVRSSGSGGAAGGAGPRR